MTKTNRIISYYLIFFGTILLVSCKSRNLVYFSDLPQSSKYNTGNIKTIETQIQSGDILNIRVNSLSVESNALFNRGNNTDATSSAGEGYLVDNSGNIAFPVIGKIKVAGFTVEQVGEKLASEVQKYVKSPTVNVKLINFKITVIGEVSKPSTFTISDKRVNLLEALGMAGDMTPYGRRENVLIIREKEGVRSMARLDLNKIDVFSSPYFLLQQNDIVYVEPDKSKQRQSDPNLRYATIITGIVTAASLFISRVVLK